MLLKLKILLILFVSSFFCSCSSTENGTAELSSLQTEKSGSNTNQLTPKAPTRSGDYPITGAERLDQYLPILKGKSVGLVVNHTSRVGNAHLVDVLLEENINIKKIFAPEHGFRGKADAGEHVADGKDAKSGLPLISLYGKDKKPSSAMLAGIDVVIFDIQDVGARFYTYISTMHYVMEACAENNKKLLVLDRPNPNGHYVDGPIREAKHKSFVGLDPIPVVHGMTVGELAKMINGEGWLENGVECDLEVISCLSYDHQTKYILPVKPSPNLPNMNAIYLYPSLCFFEGTDVSIGRGTTYQFQMVGHPDYKDAAFWNISKTPVQFTPAPNEGAKNPKHNGKVCKGMTFEPARYLGADQTGRLHMEYLVEAYKQFPDKNKFFNSFFEKLAGTDELRQQIVAGKTAEEISASWKEDLEAFKKIRAKYLIYN